MYFCCGSLRESDVPHRSVAQRPFLDDLLLHECAVLFEHLDAVVHAVAHVEQAIVRQLRAVHGIAELLIERRIRIVIAQVGVVRLVAVSAPMPLVFSRVRVEHDHALVAIAVGDVQFIGRRDRRTSSPAL